MAKLTKQQELQVAQSRITAGKGSSLDIANIDYAKSKGLLETKSPASLKGTLPAEDILPEEQPTDMSQQFNDMRTVIQDITRSSFTGGKTLDDILADFRKQTGTGQGLINPDVIGGVIQSETAKRYRTVGDIFNQTMKTISTMENRKLTEAKNQKELTFGLAKLGVSISPELDAVLSKTLSKEEKVLWLQTNQIMQEKLLEEKKLSGGGTGQSFTSIEQKKLEANGLLNASRQEQLDFLYPQNDEITSAEAQKQLIEVLKSKNLIGADGKISWENYAELERTWVASGGSLSEFKIFFPQSAWLDSDNQKEFSKYKGENS